MAKVAVRAYKVGGYGDTSAAIKIAEALESEGRDVKLVSHMPYVDRALHMLGTSVKIIHAAQHDERNRSEADAILIDAIKSRVPGEFDDPFGFPIAHIYVSEFDGPVGVAAHSLRPGLFDGSSHQFMFYRPRPYPVVSLEEAMSAAFSNVHDTSLFGQIEKFGIAYTSSGHKPGEIIHSNYFLGVKEASKKCDGIVGLVIPKSGMVALEYREAALWENWNVVTAHDKRPELEPNKPTLFITGPIPQQKLSQLHARANIPSLVTGDQTLSDAIYFALTGGHGFFYDAPQWKSTTLTGMELWTTEVKSAAKIFWRGSFRHDDIFNGSPHEDVTSVLVNPEAAREFAEGMRVSIEEEIKRQHNLTEINPVKHSPFIVQDRVLNLVDRLASDSAFREKTEQERRNLALAHDRFALSTH